MRDSFFLQLAHFLEQEVAPVAHQLDEDENLYREYYSRLMKLRVLHLLIPKELGGLGGGREEWIDFNILVAQYSGALLFLQAQHQYSISRLKSLLPQPHVEAVLRALTQQEQGIGLALQKNRTLLQVEATPEGFLLTGKFLWVTGVTYFSHLLISFEQEKDLHYTLLPLKDVIGKEGGSITLLPRIETSVFNAVTNNSVVLNKWFVSREALIATEQVKPKVPIEHPTIYNFAGAAKALLGLAIKGRYGSTTEVLKRYTILEQAWNHYYQQIKSAQEDPLALRNHGLELVERCALLARISCGSAGLLKSHPLGRILREVWQYTIAGYSEEQMSSYLKSSFFL